MGHVYAEAMAKGDLERIHRAWSAAVALSFRSHPMNHRTTAEIKRRADICQKWTRKLCEEYRWSIDRALSHIREALTAELNGVDFSPLRTRTLYAPDAAVLNPDRRTLDPL